MRILIFCIALSLSLSSCNVKSTVESASKPTAEPKNDPIQNDLGQFSEEKICKAAIAALMGRDPQIINIDKIDSEIIYTSYVRPDDGIRWENRCRIDKQTRSIAWATDTGRWRTDSADAKVSYNTSENIVRITEEYSDGSLSEDEYSLEQLNE